MAYSHLLEIGNLHMSEQHHTVFDHNLIKSLRAQLDTSYLHITFFTLVWLFTVGSIIGFVIEDVFHFIVYRNWESRAGLVWGPFSPIYGIGAVVLTVVLNRFYYTHNLIIFIFAMVLGSTIEYAASWIMETFWHAIAWDYTGTFGSIDGRTNFVFGVMWGVLGLSWVRLALPAMKRIQAKINTRSNFYRAISILISIMMLINCLITILALHREGERAHDIPAQSQIDVWLDTYFPDEWMQQRFANMTVSDDLESEKGIHAAPALPDTPR